MTGLNIDTHSVTIGGVGQGLDVGAVTASALEDFERASPLDAYSGDTGAFSDNTTDPFEGSHALNLDGPAGADLIFRTDVSLASDGTTYSYRIKRGDGSIDAIALVANSGSATGWSDFEGYDLKHRWSSDGELVIDRIDGDGTADPLASTTGIDTTGWNDNLYHWIDITLGGTDDFLIERYENTGSGKPATPTDSVSANDSTYSGFVLGWVHVSSVDVSVIDFLETL